MTYTHRPPRTLAELRYDVRQKIQDGIDPATQAEDESRASIVNVRINAQINDEVNEVKALVENNAPWVGQRWVDVTWPAATSKVSLIQLGVPGFRVDAVLLCDKIAPHRPWRILAKRIADGDRLSRLWIDGGVARGDGRDGLLWSTLTWDYADAGSAIELMPEPVGELYLSLRVPENSSFLLRYDGDELPSNFFPTQLIEQLVVLQTCGVLDSDSERRMAWVGKARSIRDGVLKDTLRPTRPRRARFVGFSRGT